MDLKQLEYIIAIDTERNISKAANKLFITQSALNQQLLKIENELDTKLFERKHPFMVPTLAGKIYISTAKRMIEMKEDTYRIIHDIANEDYGEISLTYTPEQGATLFANIYPYFHAKYPNITFKITEARVKAMEQLLLNREVDIALSIYSNDIGVKDNLEFIDLETEKILIGIPSSNPVLQSIHTVSDDKYPCIDLNCLVNENFVLMSTNTLIRDIIDLCFKEALFDPKVLFVTSSTPTVLNMVKQQICLGFIPESYIKDTNDISFFSPTPARYWTRCISYLKGIYLTKSEKYLIDLCKAYYSGELSKFTIEK
nr:LysR family transcriptional regulator [uncultured Lachnoanaerobaculum sp.]